MIVEKVEGGVLVMPELKDSLKAMIGLWKDFKPKEPSWQVIKKVRKEWDKRLERIEKIAKKKSLLQED